MAIYLTNGTYIDPVTLEFRKTTLIVYPGFKGKIEFNDFIAQGLYDEVIDCKGKLITRSFACGHHHAYSALARGMDAPEKAPVNFNEILKYIWWRLDRCLNKDAIEASALITAMACAKNGVTFIVDHHASPFAVKGSLEIIAKAFEKVGVSHLLCYEISDRDGKEIAAAGLAETSDYLKNHQGLVGLHASFTVSDNTIRKAVSLARETNSGIHIHVAEDKSDQENCVKYYHKRVIQRLNDEGILDLPKTILGHCLHLNDHEKELISRSPAWVVQNTESNLNNKVGFFDSRGLGDHIMLGTDGMHSDMLWSSRAAFLTGQTFDSIDYQGIYRRFRNVHDYLRFNAFEGDGENNLVVLDYDSPTEINSTNFYSHFLFGFESRDVQHVVSNGKIIVKDRQLANVNENEILEFARKESKKLWERMKKI